jgi:small subunit ribosomal protein S19e
MQAEPQAHIAALAKELQQVPEMKMPEWALFVKTGSQKERVPLQTDWWYLRAASMFRTIVLKGPIGTSKLRIKYGSRKNRGVRPDRFHIAGGKIIRTILQQLEAAKLVKQEMKGVHKGRIPTGAGYTLINKAAKEVQ